MLSLREISYSHTRKVLDRISFDVAPGEYVAITGPNGSGKTTLALIIAGVIQPESGSIEYCGVDYSNGEKLDTLRRGIGFLFQDPEDGILTTSVEREIAFAPENHGLPPHLIRNRVEELADAFDLRDILKKPLDELSGGELERTAFASAVSFDPKILILDEPESYLDFAGRKRLAEEIQLRQRSGTAIIHITQSSAVPAHASKTISLGYLPMEEPRRRLSISDSSSTPVLEIEKLCFSYNGRKVLSNMNFQLMRGECVAILGKSGVGKTTFARIATGLYKADSGKITSYGRAGLSFQYPARQLFADTVLDDVTFGPKSLGMSEPRELAAGALRRVGLDELKFECSPFALSDGEQRLVGLAGVLAIRPDYIFFDEPTAALDVFGRARFLEIVENLTAEGVGMAIITHDLRIAEQACSRALILEKQGSSRELTIDEILTDSNLRRSIGIGMEDEIFGGY
jgi:energy-coupling factor transport system ATP-binding protein